MTSYASNSSIFLLEANESDFLVQTSPNRDYTAQIQAQTCAGYGLSVRASGYCITMRGGMVALSQYVNTLSLGIQLHL